MELYLEYVILDNIVMDYVLIKFLEITFKNKIKKVNKFVSCLLGTILAFGLPYFMFNVFLLYLYKFITAMVIVVILRRYKGFKHYLKYLLFFMIYTFIIGGVLIGFIGLFNINYSYNGVILYDCELPIGLFVIVLMLSIWVLKRMVGVLKEQLKASKYLCDIVLVDKGVELKATGLMDSGNKVIYNGDCVSIISLDIFMKLHKEINIKKILYKTIDESELRDVDYISIGGIDENKKYLSFKIDNLIVNNESFRNQTVAVSYKNFDAFDCILNSRFIGGENE